MYEPTAPLNDVSHGGYFAVKASSCVHFSKYYLIVTFQSHNILIAVGLLHMKLIGGILFTLIFILVSKNDS